MWHLALIALVSGYNCEFQLPSGEKYDFSAFTRDMPDYEADSMEYIYRLNICADTSILCNGEFSIASQWNYKGGCYAVIARQFPTLPVLSKKDDSLILTYTNGDYCYSGPRQTNFIFHCSPKNTKIGLAEEPETCIYNFDIYSKYACFDLPVETQTSYFWMLYLVLSLILGYFVVGLIYNKVQDKTLTVLEALPHSEKLAEITSGIFNRFR